jgi:hypothetical protein
VRCHPTFSSQSEGAALHAPATLEELVDSILPWLCFALVLFPELTRINRLPYDPFSSPCPPNSLGPLVLLSRSPRVSIYPVYLYHHPSFKILLPNLDPLYRSLDYLCHSASLGKI